MKQLGYRLVSVWLDPNELEILKGVCGPRKNAMATYLRMAGVALAADEQSGRKR